MPVFEFFGRASDGSQRQGKLEASNAQTVASMLDERGIIPVIIKPAVLPIGDVQLEQLFTSRAVTTTDLIMFCRQMYTITKAGIPLVRGLRGLAASQKQMQLQAVLLDVASRLESGSNLSTALSRHPKVFNRMFVSMVNVGESTGSLEEVFAQLAIHFERDELTSRRIKSATRYPLFVVVALAMAVTIVNIFVIPKFADMFAQFNAELPLVTRFLIGMSNTFVNYWWLLLLLVGGVVVGLSLAMKMPEGAMVWGRLKLKLPVVGSIIERASMARYCHSFSLMLSAGVPLHQALTLCARALDNPFLSEKVDGIRRGVERGESLLFTHRRANILSPLVLQMVAVGEESGQVEELLAEVAQYYEREVDYDLKKLSDRIEPILILFMAGFVLVLALGIFLPMWDMYNVQKSAL